MDTFVRRYQSDRYDIWISGQDMGTHPEDQKARPTPAPPPDNPDQYYKW